MRFTTKTTMSPSDVLSRARSDFEGLDLNITDETKNRLVLESDKGFISVQLRGAEGKEVDIITEGFDRPVKDFVRRLR